MTTMNRSHDYNLIADVTSFAINIYSYSGYNNMSQYKDK